MKRIYPLKTKSGHEQLLFNFICEFAILLQSHHCVQFQWHLIIHRSSFCDQIKCTAKKLNRKIIQFVLRVGIIFSQKRFASCKFAFGMLNVALIQNETWKKNRFVFRVFAWWVHALHRIGLGYIFEIISFRWMRVVLMWYMPANVIYCASVCVGTGLCSSLAPFLCS